MDSKLKRLLSPIALFRSFDQEGKQVDNKERHFIAIAEGKTMPLYVFTYDIEAVQFVFEDPTANLDKFVLDHSIVARRHAQFISKQIADEGRLSKHTADMSELPKLVRHHKLVSIAYTNDRDHKTHFNLPLGMNERDVYLLA